MKKLKFLKFALITVLMCVGFASCGDDDKDKDEPSKDFSVVGIWDMVGLDESFDFRADGHGIYHFEVDEGRYYDDYFDYEYTPSTGKLVMRWHYNDDWTSPTDGEDTLWVKVISNDKVEVTIEGGVTVTLVRRK